MNNKLILASVWEKTPPDNHVKRLKGLTELVRSFGVSKLRACWLHDPFGDGVLMRVASFDIDEEYQRAIESDAIGYEITYYLKAYDTPQAKTA